jgi:pyocin large subunit-like protein
MAPLRMMLLRTGAAAGAVSALALVLAGCDGGSASPARSHASYDTPSAPTGSAALSASRPYAPADDGVDHRKDPVPTVEGKPMWAANRRYTAEENAQYQFEHRGSDFGATSVKDYVAKVHAFVDDPPKRVKSFVRRNGDKLLYDPKRNIFAVVTKDGAPRTMFKPQDGAAYWDQQTSADTSDRYGGGSRAYHRRSYGGQDSGADG